MWFPPLFPFRLAPHGQQLLLFTNQPDAFFLRQRQRALVFFGSFS
jgi:hypothetical protein